MSVLTCSLQLPRAKTLRRRCAVLLCGILLRCVPACAQTFQTLPEVDFYYKIQPRIQFIFQAKETREAGDPTQAEIGPSLDFSMKPLLGLKRITAFDLNEAKSRLLELSVGYRYVPSPSKATVERLELVATPHFPLPDRILLTDRNRADLDWSQGQLNWRYRNRVNLERSVRIGSYHPGPHASAEVFYLSKYHKWNTTALYAGCLLPVGKHAEFDPYYEHQNITSMTPNQRLNQFGLILNLYFQAR